MVNNEERQMGRAKNAVLSFLEQRLSIPKIYIDAVWDGRHIDVLAINRDGVGDVHAVLLFSRQYHPDGMLSPSVEIEATRRLVEAFATIPAQYKYIGAVGRGNGLGVNGKFKLMEDAYEASFGPDGIGRIGLLHIEIQGEEEPQVIVETKPERFRAKVAKIADEYIQKHEADWEIRA